MLQIAIGVALGVTCVSSAQEALSPMQMLQQVTAAYQDLKSVSFMFEGYDSLRRPDQRLRTMRFRYLAPNKWSVEYISEKPNGGSKLVCDGRYLWQYFADTNSYTKSDAVPSFADWRGAGQLGFAGSALANPKFAEQLSRFYVKPELQLAPVESGGSPCFKLTMLAANNHRRKMTLFIDEKTLLLRRAEAATEGEPSDVYSEKYTDIVVNPAFKVADFEFSPPANALEETAPPKVELIAVGSKAPDFTLKSAQGKDVKLSMYRGKPVLLYFCALSAPNNMANLDKVSKMVSAHKKFKLAMLAVECWSGAELVRKYASQTKMSHPLLLDSEKAVQKKFGVEGLPTLVLVDKSGVVRFADSGLDDETLRALSLVLAKL